jgi:flagellar basal-body rod protein FlgF
MSLYTTVAGKYVNETTLDIIANNIANSLTAGFKAIKPVFNMVSTTTASGDTKPLKNSYVSLYDTYTDFSDAPVVNTGATFDMAITGKGFFVVQGPDGPLYTRNGQFTVDSSNRLVTMNGDPVLGTNGEINITIKNGKDILVEQDGTIFLGEDSVGTLKVVDFKNENVLQPVGKSLYVNTDTAEPEITPSWYSIRQGSYESSNVNVFHEMVQMIQTMRAYECYTKIDQMVYDVDTKLVDPGKF